MNSNRPPNMGRRDFLRLAAVSAASFGFLPTVSAKVGKTLDPIPDYDGLLSKTEEYQEEFLFSLPEAEKRALLSEIRRAHPGTYPILASAGEWRHLLRTGHVALKLGKMKTQKGNAFG